MALSRIARRHGRFLLGRSRAVPMSSSSISDVIRSTDTSYRYSTRANEEEEEEACPANSENPPSSAAVYEYHGPFSAAVTKVKKLSLFSCACAVGAGPVMLLLDGGTSMTAKMGLAGTLSAFGLATTGLLHWFTHPYVHKLYVGKHGELRIETLNFFARPVVDHVQLDDVEGGAENSMHPLSTFTVNNKAFYVDKDYFADKDVLDILDPPNEEEQEQDSD